jgi:hypothetical protein
MPGQGTDRARVEHDREHARGTPRSLGDTAPRRKGPSGRRGGVGVGAPRREHRRAARSDQRCVERGRRDDDPAPGVHDDAACRRSGPPRRWTGPVHRRVAHHGRDLRSGRRDVERDGVDGDSALRPHGDTAARRQSPGRRGSLRRKQFGGLDRTGGRRSQAGSSSMAGSSHDHGQRSRPCEGLGMSRQRESERAAARRAPLLWAAYGATKRSDSTIRCCSSRSAWVVSGEYVASTSSRCPPTSRAHNRSTWPGTCS